MGGCPSARRCVASSSVRCAMHYPENEAFLSQDHFVRCFDVVVCSRVPLVAFCSFHVSSNYRSRRYVRVHFDLGGN